MKTSFLTPDELAALGLAAVGQGVRVSRFARVYSPGRIFLGDEVRIDDFAILSPGDGTIRLEGRNHVAAGAMLFGDIELGPGATISGRAAVYASSDDFRIMAPTYPYADDRKLVHSRVRIGRDVVVGTGTTVLPGASIEDGIAIGAMSLVRVRLSRPGVYVGVPVRWLCERSPGSA